MSTFDWTVLAAAIAVAYALLVGAKELTHEIRRRLRRRRVRAELAAVSRGRARVREAARVDGTRGPHVAAVHPLSTRNAGTPARDPSIGVDQVIAERRARFLRHLDERGLCVDDVRIESR